MIIKELQFNYGEFCVFKEFNFMSEALIIAIKGASGCGKTTLLKLISSDLNPDNNAIIQKFEKTYLVVQEDALIPWLSGYDNIVKFVRVSKDEIQNNALFNVVSKFIGQKAYEMSYGQRRMVELFRAILYQPQLLLLDEPFNFLDKKNRELFIKEILGVINKGTRVIMSTHYSEDLSTIEPETYYFDGHFPVRQLLSEER